MNMKEHALKYLNKKVVVYFRTANNKKSELKLLLTDVNDERIKGTEILRKNSKCEPLQRAIGLNEIIDIYPY